ncbi:MAPEG family protein [Novosphingobium tardum]|uniref:MAPEG family protein n=1 Tax=Novosphingobium tardum TaxID=1538021 RepID=A0ABV8RPI8_9SPHN
MLLPTTLTALAAAIVINIWLSIRIGRLRTSEKISVGDGGHELLGRRMRAQLNFAENVPLVLLMVAGIELAGKGGVWLLPVAALFVLGRVAHGIGMDGGSMGWGRSAGTLITMLTQLGLAIVAVLIVAQVM